MDIGSVSKRYAKALFGFAIENKEEHLVYEETKTLIAAFFNVPQLQSLLRNPVVLPEQKQSILTSAAMQESKISDTFRRFMQFIVEQKREDLIVFIAHSYQDLYRKKLNITQSRFILPTKISDESLQRLQKMVASSTSGKVDFETIEDPSILGGFILEFDTYRLDASVRTQLKHVQRVL